jgi:hypothetical protein
MRQVLWQRTLDGRDLTGDYRDSYAGKCSMRDCKIGDWRNVTLYQCDLTGADWSAGLSRDVVTVECTLTDLMLPPDMPFIGTPMIQEALRQYSLTQTGQRKEGVEALIAYLGNPLASWRDAAPYFARRPGIRAIAIGMAQECFARWPHILQRFAGVDLDATLSPGVDPYTPREAVAGDSVDVDNDGLLVCDAVHSKLFTWASAPAPTRPHDRYEIERKSEAAVKAEFPSLADLMIHIRTLTPRHVQAVLGRWLQDPTWDWWNRGL